MARYTVRETVTLLYHGIEADSEAEAIEKAKATLSVRDFDEVDCSPRDTTYKIAAELSDE